MPLSPEWESTKEKIDRAKKAVDAFAGMSYYGLELLTRMSRMPEEIEHLERIVKKLREASPGILGNAADGHPIVRQKE